MLPNIEKYDTGYQTYLRYKGVLELLGSDAYTVQQLKDKLGFKETTIYRMIDRLLKQGIVEIYGHKVVDSRGTKQVKRYRLKNKLISKLESVTKLESKIKMLEISFEQINNSRNDMIRQLAECEEALENKNGL